MTFDELKAAGFVEHHRCGACDEPVGWRLHPVFAAAVFDSGCDCVARHVGSYRLLTHDELAAIPTPVPGGTVDD